ncbi:Early light-induced protein 2, chloroplastic [Capsicum annuum]|uniref:early light-induced protein, chloroplastic isoform 1 n=1 Tax=Capsicum annuum TaxID=4072 RepID=UPI001FB04EB5|nr:early light-induced protein, chloroplastic isoform 1 [Capsicum annuum]KAF3646914.1 Early light-induced protein 2, chloroplastic [Capsicum annuum]KAF3664067.1 Early light-induced protein 2, chloroplastic [Capsicum annuum]
MTTSFAMQSMILGSPVTSLSQSRNGLNQFVPSSYLPRLHRNTRLRVKCMSEEGEKSEESFTPSTTDTAATPKLTPPPAKPKSSTDFFDLFSFSGPAPERINGRLAMIGFVAAIGVELANGGDLSAQLSSGGLLWFLGSSVLLTLASIIPLFQGVTAESKSGGFMSADAEIWNGRFAMLGLVALAFTEYVKGGGLFQV